jgi:predicted ATPase
VAGRSPIRQNGLTLTGLPPQSPAPTATCARWNIGTSRSSQRHEPHLMQHTSFRILNYRGIADVKFSLDASPKARVYTLVGLNESGKTTILEAINSFSRRIDLDPLDMPGYATRDVHELIPISKRSNFNGNISIEVGFECDADDEKAIAAFARKELDTTIAAPVGRFTVEQRYTFKNSAVTLSQPQNLWTIKFQSRKKGERKNHAILHADERWQKLVAFIRDNRLPNVVYFPNFLFELPDRIYLEATGADDKKHEFYRAVLQDVLDAIGEQTNTEEHILARAKSGSAHDKKSLESVLLKMGSHITHTVFSSWNRIFNRASAGKEIIVFLDKDEAGRWYLQLRLKDGSDLYSISERSLGFRWFFAFLLLTQYRGFRKTGPRGALFLFDEPASNLHPSAQAQLLSSFGRFPTHAPIIYTTHSHHMVNPEWLEGTYVVKNEGLNYDEHADTYTSRQTLVTMHRYRSFAAAHPDQTTYLQPILDVLAYQPSKLENIPEVVMLEGKNDFYSLSFMGRRASAPPSLNFLPGNGAGSLDHAIRLYLGWGRKFVVLLDGDKEGIKQKKRYIEEFGSLVSQRVITLADIDPQWDGAVLEDLFADIDKEALLRTVYPDPTPYSKTLFNRAVQELLVTNASASLSPGTESAFSSLLDGVSKRLVAL